MEKALHHYFIPHAKNDHQPYLLRSDRLALVVALVLAVELLFALTPYFLLSRGSFLGEVVSQVLVDETNTYRSANQLQTLTVNPKLVQAAELKAADMVSRGYFAHTSPSGVTPWYWLDTAGYSYRYAGENLAVNFFDSKDVADAWMKSPLHRENMLSEHFSEIGIATAHGQYQGHDSVFVVQFFGRPAAAAPSPVTTAPVVAPTETKTAPVSLPKPVVAAPAPATPKVAGIEVEQAKGTFVAVENVTAAAPIATPVSAPVAEAPAVSAVWSHPRGLAQTLLLIIGFIVALAGILKLFIRFERGHAPLIVNAVFVVSLIGALIGFNFYLFAAAGSVF